jgi:hypothetical protein
MFLGPFLLYLTWHATEGFSTFDVALLYGCISDLSRPASLDDYGIHLLAILSASFLWFIVLTVLYCFFDFWGKLGYWKRYGLMLGLYILNAVLIGLFVSLLMDRYNVLSSCPGGSPLLFIAPFFILLYVPLGFVWTLIIANIKANPFD